MSSQTVAIIQARMGSSRFPGKMLARLGQHTVFEWVVLRLIRAKLVDRLVLATSDRPLDSPLAEIARSYGLMVFLGNETDVLERFVGAAVYSNAKNIVRVCADNPFIGPDEVDCLIKYFYSSNHDYAFNHQSKLNSCHADGFGAEILSFDILKEISLNAKTTEDREHVTKYIWENKKKYNLGFPKARPDLAYPQLCFDINTPADLIKLQKIVDKGITSQSTATDIVQAMIES